MSTNENSRMIREELDELLCAENTAETLLENRERVAEIVPEIRRCFDFEQHSKYHKYNVYEHIAHAVESVPEESVLLRRAMLFHDIGKPEMFTMDENGVGHFKGHAAVSAEMAEKIMARLGYDKDDISLTKVLISHHSDKIENECQIKRLVSEIGKEHFIKLIKLKKADNSAKRDFVLTENDVLDNALKIAESLDGEGNLFDENGNLIEFCREDNIK